MFKKNRKDILNNPDLPLIMGLKSGDRTAYLHFLQKYYNTVYLILSAVDESGNESQIREKASHILLDIWAKRAQIPLHLSPKQFLFTFIYKQFEKNGGKI
jgi:hypothetical protein